MAEEIEFRLPSAIPYAYVGVKGTAEELSQVNFEMLASLYAGALNVFQESEERMARLIVQGALPAPVDQHLEASGPTHKVGDTVTVAGMEFTKHSENPFEGEDVVADTIKESLGATEIDSVNAPWEAPPKGAKPKPWEKKKPTATINVDDFDF